MFLLFTDFLYSGGWHHSCFEVLATPPQLREYSNLMLVGVTGFFK